jgi:hypothetical protein
VFDFNGFLATLAPVAARARHTVGLLDPITAGDRRRGAVDDGPPETLERSPPTPALLQAPASGDRRADLERLAQIASVSTAVPGAASRSTATSSTRDDAVVALWSAMEAEPALQQLCAATLSSSSRSAPVALARSISRWRAIGP